LGLPGLAFLLNLARRSALGLTNGSSLQAVSFSFLDLAFCEPVFLFWDFLFSSPDVAESSLSAGPVLFLDVLFREMVDPSRSELTWYFFLKL
jgi:hypothetical protein